MTAPQPVPLCPYCRRPLKQVLVTDPITGEVEAATWEHISAATLGRKTSPRKAQASRTNGARPTRPGSRPRGRPRTKKEG